MAGNSYHGEDSLKKLLLQACDDGDISRVKSCLNLDVDINYQAQRDSGDNIVEGDTALHLAIHYGDIEIVKLLLKNQNIINVNHRNKKNERPISLMKRGSKNGLDILKLLLKVPSLNLDFKCENNLHFSHEVCKSDSLEYITIISKDPRFKINALNSDGETPIAVAVRENDWNLFNILFTNPNVDKSVISPLLVTAINHIHLNGLEVTSTVDATEADFKTTVVHPTREVNLTSNNERLFRIASEHFHRMKSGFHQIQSITLVSNTPLEEKFNQKKADFRNRGINCNMIFGYHGTKASYINNIMKNNFDANLWTRRAHGTGNYFSEGSLQ